MEPAQLDFIASLQWVCMTCECVRLSVAEPGERSACGYSSWDNASDLGTRDTAPCLVVVDLKG